jgi:hypothetical protein
VLGASATGRAGGTGGTGRIYIILSPSCVASVNG